MTKSTGWVQNSGATGQWAVKGRLDVQNYGWKGSRFWPQKRSFSASIPQVLIFYMPPLDRPLPCSTTILHPPSTFSHPPVLMLTLDLHNDTGREGRRCIL
jgi:hypothetical protein